jgi:hypothetical protein
MHVNLGWSAVTTKYSTCILFIPSEVTMELVKTVADHESCSQFTNTTKLLHLIHTIPLSHTSWIRTSNKEWGNNMHLLIYQEHNNISHLTDHPIK